MDAKEQLERIRAAVIRANPEIVNGRDDNFKVAFARPIRLADVLLALAECPYQFKTELGPTVMRFDDNGNDWNLLKDSLDQQSPETITFLDQLLSK